MLLLRFLMREEMYLDSVSTDIGHTPIRRSVGFWLTTIFFILEASEIGRESPELPCTGPVSPRRSETATAAASESG
jgi:hypothetical protein